MDLILIQFFKSEPDAARWLGTFLATPLSQAHLQRIYADFRRFGNASISPTEQVEVVAEIIPSYK